MCWEATILISLFLYWVLCCVLHPLKFQKLWTHCRHYLAGGSHRLSCRGSYRQPAHAATSLSSLQLMGSHRDASSGLPLHRSSTTGRASATNTSISSIPPNHLHSSTPPGGPRVPDTHHPVADTHGQPSQAVASDDAPASNGSAAAASTNAAAAAAEATRPSVAPGSADVQPHSEAPVLRSERARREWVEKELEHCNLSYEYRRVLDGEVAQVGVVHVLFCIPAFTFGPPQLPGCTAQLLLSAQSTGYDSMGCPVAPIKPIHWV